MRSPNPKSLRRGEWIKVEATEENFCAFGLDENFAAVRIGARAGERGMSVHHDCEVLAIAGDLHTVPYASRLFDFVWSTKAFNVLPRIAARAIEPCNVRAFS